VVELVAASELGYDAYAEFQRDAFRDLLARTGASADHMTPELYRWKYHTPAGPALLARIRDGNRILSSSAMLPLRVSCGGKAAVGWHCVDVATLPEARRRGFLRATLRALKDAVPDGDLFFAFPNAGSIGSFLELGCREQGVVRTWVNPWVRAVGRPNRLVERVARFDAVDDVAGRGADVAGTHVARSSEYLDWRYSDHPITHYASFVLRDRDRTGFCVVRKARVMNRELAVVMELHGSSRGVRAALLVHAAGWARSEGVGMMVMMDTGMAATTALRSLLAPVPSFLMPKRQVLVVSGGAPPPVPTSGRWLVQTGDWDVF
jgi:GNAT superfamily N-acetyltransferase